MAVELAEDSELASLNDVRSRTILDDFFTNLASAPQSALMLDYDGTLAPFRVDASQARPWAGIVGLLDQIELSCRSRIVFVSGRPAEDVARLLGLKQPPEVWGLHGSEHLFRDGHLERAPLAASTNAALDAARHAIQMAELGFRIENKPNSVAVHWRGKTWQSSQAARQQALEIMSRFLHGNTMKLLQFDGGLELRAGCDKGDAVRAVLGEVAADAMAAYLGDDTTDEDAFKALADRGLSILVRKEPRPSAAQIWIRPPAQLRHFLTRWLRAVSD